MSSDASDPLTPVPESPTASNRETVQLEPAQSRDDRISKTDLGQTVPQALERNTITIDCHGAITSRNVSGGEAEAGEASGQNGPSEPVGEAHAETGSFDLRFGPKTESERASVGVSRYLGEYELLEEIARGGMGVVYRARQVKLNRLVALKLVRDASLAGPSELRRFRTEAEAIARLDHPNIVPIFEIGQVNDQPYFSMKLIEGGNLTRYLTWLQENSREAARIMACVSRAVHYAHQRAILHRDIKPSNILLDEEKEPYVTDFGLAKRFDEGNPSALTVTGALMGTPSYMPPEQASGGSKSLTTAADVYSLGATLYEALTGQPPFKGDSVAETLRLVVDDEPIRPRVRNATIDRDLETITLKCLAKEPTRRYGTAAELADDLERWNEGRPISARPVGPGERALKWVKRRPSLAALILALHLALIGLVATGVWFTLQLRDALQAAESNLYAADMILAGRYARERQPHLALPLLSKHVPNSPTAHDQRSFEWFFLRDQCEPQHVPSGVAPLVALAFHPSGNLLAFDSDERGTCLWNLDENVEVASLRRQVKVATYDLAVSPDGQWLTHVEGNERVHLWSAKSRQIEKSFEPRSGYIWSVAFSPDSRRLGVLCSRTEMRNVHLYDISTESKVLSIHVESKEIGIQRPRGLGFSPDGQTLAFARDRDIVICDARSGIERRTLSGHAGFVTRLNYSPDGSLLASSSIDGTACIWTAETGELRHTLKSGRSGSVHCVVFSPDGRRVATAGAGNLAHVWDVETGQEVSAIAHPNEVRSVAFSTDGTRLATASRGSDIMIWNLAGIHSTVVEAQAAAITNAVLRSDARQFASLAEDRSFCLWNLDERLRVQPPLRVELPFEASGLAYDPEGGSLAICGETGEIQVHDTEDGRRVTKFPAHSGTIMSLAYRPDGRHLAAVGTEGLVRIFDVATRQVLNRLEGHRGTVAAVAYSPDGSRLATAGGDQEIRVWDTTHYRLADTLSGHDGWVNCLAFDAESRRLLSGSEAGRVSLWDLDGLYSNSRTISQEPVPVLSVAFSPDGRRIATSGEDRSIKIRDSTTGQETLDLDSHTDLVTSVSFARDASNSTFLLSSSKDGTIRLWAAPKSE